LLTFLLVAGLGFLAAAVTLVARALIAASSSATETIQQIASYGYDAREHEVDGARSTNRAKSLREALDRIATSLGDTIAPHFTVLSERSMRERLVRAGMYGTGTRKIIGYQILIAFGGAFVWVWLAGLERLNTGVLLLGLVGILVVGWLLPLAYIDSKGRRRRDEIERTLPDVIDLLVVTLEAGLSLPQSLRLASSRLRGAIAQELRLTLQEQNMGLTLVEALANFQRRIDTPAVRLFARSIAQGETLGVPIGQLMRNLAEEMRKRRKAYAEEKAHKAPVKMLFPLVFLIYPAVFIVLVLPAMLNLGDLF
jgi:tight adherence protein C